MNGIVERLRNWDRNDNDVMSDAADELEAKDKAIERYQGYMLDLKTLIGRALDRGDFDRVDLRYWASLIDSCLPPQPSSTPNT